MLKCPNSYPFYIWQKYKSLVTALCMSVICKYTHTYQHKYLCANTETHIHIVHIYIYIYIYEVFVGFIDGSVSIWKCINLHASNNKKN